MNTHSTHSHADDRIVQETTNYVIKWIPIDKWRLVGSYMYRRLNVCKWAVSRCMCSELACYFVAWNWCSSVFTAMCIALSLQHNPLDFWIKWQNHRRSSSTYSVCWCVVNTLKFNGIPFANDELQFEYVISCWNNIILVYIYHSAVHCLWLQKSLIHCR